MSTHQPNSFINLQNVHYQHLNEFDQILITQGHIASISPSFLSGESCMVS